MDLVGDYVDNSLFIKSFNSYLDRGYGGVLALKLGTLALFRSLKSFYIIITIYFTEVVICILGSLVLLIACFMIFWIIFIYDVF